MTLTTRFSIALSALAIPLLVVGCSADMAGPPPDETVPTAFEMLLDQPELALVPGMTWVEMTARVDRGSTVLEDTTRIEVDRGNLFLSTDQYGTVHIDGLAISFHDVVAGKGMLSENGFHFTDIVARMETPTSCDKAQWQRDGNHCSTTASLDINLDWSLVMDDQVYPLGTQKLGTMDLNVEIYQKRGELFAELDGTAEGVFWHWAGIVEFSDLTLYTTAVQKAPVVH